MKTPKRTIPYFTTETTVEVEIDPDDLHDAGWHHEDECKNPVEYGNHAVPVLPNEDIRALGAALASLHRQAHPSAGSVRVCHEEPCRSLTLDQLDQVTS